MADQNTGAPPADTQTLGGLQGQTGRLAAQALANHPMISPGFGSLAAFELLTRQANLLASTTLVPPQYRKVIQKLDYKGDPKGPAIENANGLANCVVAMNMAQRMGADPLMVMQNLVVVEGRPSWSSQWVIAQINNCGNFSSLRFDMKDLGEKTVTREYFEWDNVSNNRLKKTEDVPIRNKQCIAWALPHGFVMPPNIRTLEQAIAANLPVIEGPPVSIEMAVLEGWYTKNGSKWRTMPELMMQYRAGTFFGRLHAPELLMGFPTDDEARDMGTLVPGADGVYAAEPAAAPAATTVDQARAGAGLTPSAAPGPVDTSTAEDATVKTGDNKTDAPAAESGGAASEPATAPAGEGAAASTAPPPVSDSLFGKTD